jgi:hypothetical protein
MQQTCHISTTIHHAVINLFDIIYELIFKQLDANILPCIYANFCSSDDVSDGYSLVSIHKWSFCPISALCSKNNPRNINYMPVVIFFACLDLEQKFSFMDGHSLI